MGKVVSVELVTEAEILARRWVAYSVNVDDQYVWKKELGVVSKDDTIRNKLLSDTMKELVFSVSDDEASLALNLFINSNCGDITCLDVFEYFLTGREEERWHRIKSTDAFVF